MTTITKERLLKIQHWRETYGADSNVMLPAEEAAELARIALASLEVAPVGEVSEKRHGLVMDGTVDLGGKSTYRIIKGEKAMKRLPLGTKFYIAPPVPVVPPEKWVNPDINYAEENGFAEGWNACRAAMLNGDTFRENSISSTNNFREMAETSTNSPVIPDGWISCSERMPEDEQEVIVHNKLGYRYVSYFDEHSGLFFDMRGGNQMNCIEHILVTHWRPMPAAPKPEQS
ncbi:DUF551 domain-containing protein [Salmonella enterica]|nr:DUF551 domain-containing protein [Salmonella enterica]